MAKCMVCGYSNPDRVPTCRKCGTERGEAKYATLQGIRISTGLLNPKVLDNFPDVEFNAQGSDIFPENGRLRIEVQGESAPVFAVVRREVIFGRRDPALPNQPDVDLSPYAGYRMGVSRRHARVIRAPEGYLMLADLGSSNGTFINKERVITQNPKRLHDGDEVIMGELIMKIYYETRS